MQIMTDNGQADTRDPAIAAAVQLKLQQEIDRGKARTGTVIERVLSEVPDDAIVKGERLSFPWENNRLQVHAGNHQWGVHSNAFAQLCQRAGIPADYAKRLRDAEEKDEPWRRELLSHTLSEHYGHLGGRYLLRSVGGEARGFLSDRYKRLDSRPLLEAFVTAVNKVGAVPYEGVGSDTRASVRVILPEIKEPVPGEFMVFGLSWQNSDYGNGAYGVSAFALRLMCLNGWISANALKAVHIGGKLSDDIAFSDETHRLDTKTNVSATHDAVKQLLSSEAVDRRCAAYAETFEQPTTWNAQRRSMQNLTKAEQKAVRESFEGDDVIMLPRGQTKARFANALSWVANKTENPERKLELQGLAGKVVQAA